MLRIRIAAAAVAEWPTTRPNRPARPALAPGPKLRLLPGGKDEA
jgi:hypothetical protein